MIKISFTIKFSALAVLLFPAVSNTCFSQLQNNGFMIGIFDAPSIKANFRAVPADYNNDGKADISVKTSGGYWLIDYADSSSNGGFGSWDQVYAEYGDDSAIPVPGDYDGDGSTDLAVKTDSGLWLVDKASNGLGGWDLNFGNSIYGGTDSHPVPGYYNDDAAMDMAVKTDDGFWKIDYADPSAPNNGFGSWDSVFTQYGGPDAHPAPADYNGDGLTDLAVKKDNDGGWLIDYSVKNHPSNGFGGWDIGIPTTWLADAIPVPGDYNGDTFADLAVKQDGKWKIDYADSNLPNNGFGDSIVVFDGYGNADAYPVTADYDNDGKSDLSIISVSTGKWLIDTSYFGGWDYASKIGNFTDYHYLLGPTLPYYYNDFIKFQKIKDAHVDFLIPQGDMFSSDNYSRMYAYLELAKQNSLKVLLSEHRIVGYQDPDGLPELKQELKDYFKYNLPAGLDEAIMGFFLADEPNFTSYDNVKKWSDFFKVNFPEKALYYNLFPRYWQGLSSDNDYDSYLDMYINTNETDFVSYDHYPLKENESFKTDFFYNLKAFKDKLGNDRPFWFVVQSHNGIHGNFTPSPYDPKLKFITSSAVAYGAKGLLYWSYMNGIEENAETYSVVKKVNRFLKEVVGPVVSDSEYSGTLHKSDTYMNQNRPFGVDELIALNTSGVIKDVNNNNILLGLFTKPGIDSSIHYIWVVNKDIDNNAVSTQVKLEGSYQSSFISPRVDTYISPNNAFTPISRFYSPSLNTTTITIPQLLPGEGVMLKVVKRNSIVIPCPTIDHNLISLNK